MIHHGGHTSPRSGGWSLPKGQKLKRLTADFMAAVHPINHKSFHSLCIFFCAG
jgi:hypothetical protein